MAALNHSADGRFISSKGGSTSNIAVLYENVLRTASRSDIVAGLEKVHSACRWDGLRCGSWCCHTVHCE